MNTPTRGGGANQNGSQPAGAKEQMVRVDGRGQVLDMLRAADPEFRETILRGLEKRDAQLARELRRQLRSDY